MAEKISVVPLQKVMSQAPETSAVIREYIRVLLEEDIPVMCVNRSTGKKRLMPFKVMYNNNKHFWVLDGSWEYFLYTEDFTRVREKSAYKPAAWEFEIVRTGDEKADDENAGNAKAESAQPSPVQEGYGREYEGIAAMTDAQKVQRIIGNKQRLDSLGAKKHMEPEAVTNALVDTTKDAAMINHAALLNAIQHADNEAKELTRELVDSTCDMVKSSVNLISEDIFNDDMMNTLVEKSNGTIVQHMTRVYLNGLAFLAYYNKLVSTSSIINKLRISFAARYYDFYSGLLPHLSKYDLHLENVFYKGMRAIPMDFFYRWAVGFLIHDIGKAAAVDYHEGSEAYNRDIVVNHVKIGYTSVMNKTNYPKEAGLIIGYHHEYYGDNSGYGYFRAYLEQYRKLNPALKQEHCIAYELEPMMDFQTYAYFPAKVLEIIDVFDSVTDPNRKYHRAMTSEEALVMMRDEFIVKHRKIDALLFDIFSAFVRQKRGESKSSLKTS